MRWIYADPNRAEERRFVEDTTRAIDDWWRAFAAKKDDLHALFKRNANWNLPAFMKEHLGAVNSHIMWEFGPPVRGGQHRLVLTPEFHRHLRPIVSTLLERAPRIEGWELYPYRIAESPDMAVKTVEARQNIDISDATVEVTRGEHQRIDLRYSFQRCKSAGDERAMNAAFVLTESLLGEEVLDQWIGAIDVVPAKRSLLGKAKTGGMPIAELRDRVASEIAAIQDALPDKPCIDREDTWVAWEMDPEERADYVRRTDMIVGSSMNPKIVMAVHSRYAFFSSSFSRHGETFCYVKVDERYEERADVEDQIDEALRAARAGSTIGGGSGLRYSYFDLALLDVERGIEVVRKVLRERDVPSRSWIEFFDDTLAAEWVGIWPDAPEPPLTPREP